MSRTLQIVGLVALVAWTALGLFAWTRVGGDVQLVLEPAGGGERSGELSLLADQVGALSADVGALGSSVEASLGRLAEGLETREADAEARWAALDERLRGLETGRAAAGIVAVRPVAGGDAAAVPTIAGAAQVPAAPGTALSASDDSLPSPQGPGEPPSSAGAGDPAPRRGSFLAFDLPARDFRFAGRREYGLLPTLSHVGFDAKSTLHDFTGACSRVEGAFTVDLAHPEAGIEGSVRIELAELITGIDARDEEMRERLDAGSSGRIVFEAASFEPGAVDPEARRVAGTIRGTMTIRGRTRELAMAVEAHVDEARRLVIEGEAPLRLTDYGVSVPKKLGLISMEDEVRVWVHLRAR